MRPGLFRVRIAFFLFLSLAVAGGPAAAQEMHTQGADNKAADSKAAMSAAAANEGAGSSDRVIMKVGGKKITEKEFESTIGEIEPKGDPDKGAEEKDRRRLGSDYASVVMLSQQALASRLDDSPEVRRKLAVARLQILSDAQFATLLSQTEPAQEEIHRYYDAHLSEFDRVRIRRLFIWKVGAASKNTHGLPPEQAAARASAILQESASGGDAIKMAEMFKGSDQGILDAEPLIFVRGQLPAALDKAAFTIKVGQWTEAEDTPDHIILVYLFARDREPLSDVTAQIAKIVQGVKMQTKLDEMKKKAGIWMDEKYFGSAGEIGSAVGKDSEDRPVSGPPSDAQKLK